MSELQLDPADAATPEELFRLPDVLPLNLEVPLAIVQRTLAAVAMLQANGNEGRFCSQHTDVMMMIWLIQGQLEQLKQCLDRFALEA